MSKIEGLTSFSSLDRRSAGKYHLFIIVNVFFGSLITGAAFEQLQRFLKQTPSEYAFITCSHHAPKCNASWIRKGDDLSFLAALQNPKNSGRRHPNESYFLYYLYHGWWLGWHGCRGSSIGSFSLIPPQKRIHGQDSKGQGRSNGCWWHQFPHDRTPHTAVFLVRTCLCSSHSVHLTIHHRLLCLLVFGFPPSGTPIKEPPFSEFSLKSSRMLKSDCTFGSHLQIINVYDQKYESAAAFWPDVHRRVIIGLTMSQLLLMGLLSTKSVAKSTPVLLALPILTIWFHRFCKGRFEPAFVRFPLQVNPLTIFSSRRCSIQSSTSVQ